MSNLLPFDFSFHWSCNRFVPAKEAILEQIIPIWERPRMNASSGIQCLLPSIEDCVAIDEIHRMNIDLMLTSTQSLVISDFGRILYAWKRCSVDAGTCSTECVVGNWFSICLAWFWCRVSEPMALSSCWCSLLLGNIVNLSLSQKNKIAFDVRYSSVLHDVHFKQCEYVTTTKNSRCG